MKDTLTVERDCDIHGEIDSHRKRFVAEKPRMFPNQMKPTRRAYDNAWVLTILRLMNIFYKIHSIPHRTFFYNCFFKCNFIE